MKQYRYILDYDLSMPEMIGQIRCTPEYISGMHGLLQLVEPGCDADVIQEDLDILAANIPNNMTIYGMTSHGALSRETHSVEYRVCSVIFFDEATFSVDVFDCSNDLTPSMAGDQFKEILAEKEDIKCVLMMSSDFALCPEKFIDKINSFNKDIIVFGALAGTQSMGDDKSKIYVGRNIYDRGILAITFCGKKLHVDHYYNLGFKPLGKELVVTKSDANGIVYEINNKPAFSIYSEHLGIGMNPYFFENTCAFPFYLKENGIGLARVALDYHDDGALAFATEIPEGSSVSLSYSTTDFLLEESANNAIKLADFCPEAILIYACMSRRMLMGDEMAELEFDFYENIIPSTTWAHGYGEILHADGVRGFLNASFVAIGMREGDAPESQKRPIYDFNSRHFSEYTAERGDGYVPLPIRLVNFLESTTKDLNEAIGQLFKVASLDELTQVYNRRALNHFMAQFIENRTRYSSIAVLMVDVDHFKNINDKYGHDAGDIVLRDGVAKVKYLFSQADIIGRWGGEEFIGIKPNISFEEAKEFCESIRTGVENIDFPNVGHITISVGLTMVKEVDDIESVFKRVDEALYEAKKLGRNRVASKI